MEIIVCIKQVPQMTGINKTIKQGEREYILNPSDAYAIEEALQIKEMTNATVTAVSMGNEEGKSILRYAFSLGVDKGILLSDRHFAGADTLATSYTLSLEIKKNPYSLVICGSKTSDGSTGQIGPSLAEQLNIPHACNVTGIVKITDSYIICKRKASNHYIQTVKIKLPALIVVEDELNVPQMPTIKGMATASEKELLIMNCETIQADKKRCGQLGSKTQVISTSYPSFTKKIEYLDGDLKETCVQLDDKIKELIMK